MGLFFAYYLVHNQIPSHFNPALPFLDIWDDEEDRVVVPGKERKILTRKYTKYEITLQPFTSKEDILNAWGQVSKIINPSQRRNKESKTLDRNIQMTKMYKNGHGYQAIKEWLKRKYPEMKAVTKHDITKIASSTTKKYPELLI